MEKFIPTRLDKNKTSGKQIKPMTVQALLEQLQAVEDKTREVCCLEASRGAKTDEKQGTVIETSFHNGPDYVPYVRIYYVQ